MPILAFDTSAAHCAAAVLSEGRIVASRVEAMEKGQAERLLPMLEEVLTQAGMRWADLASLAVGTGPGNFTGIRIGVAAARGLALGLGIGAVGVTRLEALAFGMVGPVRVIEDARRGSVYVRGFGCSPSEARLMTVSEASALPAAPVVGSGATLVGAAPVPPPYPLVEAIARIAARAGAAPRPAPFYLRAADASPPADPPPVVIDA